MTATETIAERWLARMLESYPSQTAQFLREQPDQFRNPAGHTFRDALGVLADEVQGNMDRLRIEQALDAIVRLRAVQDFSAAEAVRFVFLFRSVLATTEPGRLSPQVQNNIDELALLAFDAYMRCRDQIAEIRGREAWRCPQH